MDPQEEKRHKEIENQLKDEKKTAANKMKLLLLGTSPHQHHFAWRPEPDEVRSQKRDRAVADDDDPPAGPGSCFLQRTEHNRRGLDERCVEERDSIGEPVHEPRRHENLIAGATLARKAELVVDLTGVGLPCETVRALPAGDNALGDAAVAGRDVTDAVADRLDGSRPLVPERERIRDERGIDISLPQFEVGAAQAAIRRPNDDLPWPGCERRSFEDADRARLRHDERAAGHPLDSDVAKPKAPTRGAPSCSETLAACPATVSPIWWTRQAGRSSLIPVTLIAPMHSPV